MRFGLFVLSADPGEPAATTYDHLRADAEWADAHALDTLWLAEHHGDSYGGHVPSIAVAATAVACWTERVRIGSAAVLLPFRDPRLVAEEFAMVDVLSGGRLELGVGRGFVPHELAAFRVSPERQWMLFEEGLATIARCWAREGDDDCDADGVGGRPRPAQSPHPPIWLAASKTRATFELAGRGNYGLLLNPYTRTDDELADGLAWFRAARGGAGHGGPERIMAMQHLFIAETDERAYEAPRDALWRYFGEVDRVFSRGSNIRSGSLIPHSYDKLYADRLCFGTPARVAAHIARWAELGVTDLAFMTRFGGLSEADVSTSLALFAETIGAAPA
jgi:alkanesulfonate monooxygenase SsuD/methylene tetrahydromethanopterin reductase-like flavin-dependent oxidoreductase (luciferase family)